MRSGITSSFRLFFAAVAVLMAVSASADTLQVGYIGSLTGDSAAIGSEIAKTLEVAAAEVNSKGGVGGRQIELVIEDDGYQVPRAITAYEKLRRRVNSGVIFMTTYGALFALGKRPEKDNVLIVDTLDCNDDLVRVSAMHTCVATRTESIGEGFLEATAEVGQGNLGVLYEEEAWFNFIVGTLRRGRPGKLVEITAPVQAGDYRAELMRLKEKRIKHLVFLGNDSMGRAMAQARSLGVDAQFYSIAGVMSPGFQKLAGKALEGTLVSNWLIPRGQAYAEFSQRFNELHRRPIYLEFVAGPTVDAARLVFSALNKLYLQQKAVAPADLRREMPRQPALKGVSGVVKMDPDGAVRTIREAMFKFENGNLVPLRRSAAEVKKGDVR